MIPQEIREKVAELLSGRLDGWNEKALREELTELRDYLSRILKPSPADPTRLQDLIARSGEVLEEMARCIDSPASMPQTEKRTQVEQGCQHSFAELIGYMEGNPHFVCMSCGVPLEGLKE